MDAQRGGGDEVPHAHDVFVSYAHKDAEHDVPSSLSDLTLRSMGG